ERFRFLAETLPSFVWTADPDGTLTYTNRRWLVYCGISGQESPSAWTEAALHPDDLERCRAAWRDALRDGREYETEARYRRYDGVYRWFLTRAVPQRGVGQGVVGWFGVTMDIHDQKELAERLRETDRLKDQFLAMLSHELRNPLAAIRGALEVVCDPRRSEAD